MEQIGIAHLADGNIAWELVEKKYRSPDTPLEDSDSVGLR